MPEEKFITRRKGLIFETPDGTMTHSGQRKGVKAFQKDFAKNVAPIYSDWSKAKRNNPTDPFIDRVFERAVSEGDVKSFQKKMNVEARADSKAVTSRDATNARIARERLASRASKAQPRAGRMTSNMAAMGPMAGAATVADALYAADEATGFRRTKYSGNSGGPSFSMNPYASSNKSSYAGQSAMSKAMGVGKKK
jgi:hypothetical protein